MRELARGARGCDRADHGVPVCAARYDAKNGENAINIVLINWIHARGSMFYINCIHFMYIVNIIFVDF